MRIPFARHTSAIADQALYSISNFALHILLARWLLEEQYGAFATTYAVLYLVILVHTAILVEPMLVFGSRKYRDRIFAYYRVLVRFHVILSVVLALAFLAGFQLLKATGEFSLAQGAIGIAGSLGFTLLFYMYRKVCYVVDRVGSAAVAGGAYLLVTLSGAFALFEANRLTILSAYLLMGFGALVATLVLHLLLGIRSGRSAADLPSASEALRDHLNYGRWALGTAILIWIPSKIYYLILPHAGGLEANAELRALMNLVMPIVQANMALATVMLPSLARIRSADAFQKHLRKFTLVVAGGTAIYWLFIGSFGSTLIELAYGGRYLEKAPYLWLMGAVPIASWLALAERSALKAVERPDLVFWANVGSATLALTAGVYLTYRFGVVGAVEGMLISYAAMFVILRVQRNRLWKGAKSPFSRELASESHAAAYPSRAAGPKVRRNA